MTMLFHENICSIFVVATVVLSDIFLVIKTFEGFGDVGKKT